jgi:pyridoxal phosphate enzyme (YggS family)
MMTSTNTPGENPEARQITTNLDAVRREVEAACRRANRNPQEVSILPVTKYVDTELVRHLHAAGIRDVGESTIQETLRKQEILTDLGDLRWHLIGHLQRNKVQRALQHFNSLHSIDSLRLALAVDRRLQPHPRDELRIFIQVNVSGEATKHGLAPDELAPLLEQLTRESSLHSRIAGLMTVAPLSQDVEEARPFFRRLRELRDDGVHRGLLPDRAGLSMGMSRDLGVAIEEGATVVRVGSRIFAGLPSRRPQPRKNNEAT